VTSARCCATLASLCFAFPPRFATLLVRPPSLLLHPEA
jgi:hypothetical protein